MGGGFSCKIFGIEIERKTDILAFAAFIISVSSLVAQGVNLVRGPEILLEPPKQVLLRGESYPDQRVYTRIAATLVYLNKGSPGYDDIVREETAIIEVGDTRFTLHGQDYVSTGVREGGFYLDKKSDADPVQIASGSVVTHENYFAPWPEKGATPSQNYIEFTRFLALLAKETEVNITFISKTFGGTVNEQQCTLRVKEFSEHLKRKGWSAPVCH